MPIGCARSSGGGVAVASSGNGQAAEIHPGHLLEVSDITVNFGGIVALDGLSFSIERGHICGLIGPNGAGKTTMFNVVSRIYEPSIGSIRYEGQDLLAVPAHRIAHLGIARTFQNLALFPTMTLLENVMVGAHSTGNIGFARGILRIGAAKENRQMRDWAGYLLGELGLGPLAFRPAVGLPFGTLKRLEIARALAARPQFLLMDEPAAGLTHAEVDELADTVVGIRDQFGLTILLVEQNAHMALKVAHRAYVLEVGRITMQGDAKELAASDDVRKAYLGAH